MIFIALTNIVGFYPLYFSALQQIKSEVRLKLSTTSDLAQLQVSDAEFNASDVFNMAGENEFNFKGHRYDYQGLQKTNGGYIFYVLEDTKELSLVDFLTAAYGQENATDKNNHSPFNNLLKKFSKDFVTSFPKPVNVLRTNNPLACFFPAKSTICFGYCGLILDPPDKSC